MLPQDTPNYNWDKTNNSVMQFRYDLFMPKGILWQFIVTMYRYIKNHDWVWRNGVILERNGTKAEVRENLSDRRIYLRLSGTSIAEFRAIIADRLDEISQSYHKLKYDKMVPCSCSICRSSSEPHFFRFSVLKKRQVTGKKHTIECEISEEDVPLKLLLEGFDLPNITEKFLDDNQELKPQPNKPMKTIKIFLASSSELKADRKEFEIFINRKNNEYVEEGIFLKLVLWEDFLDAMSSTRLQDEYNKAVAGCDVFVSLFYTKVGKYTAEEFEKAFKTFKDNNKPLLYTYFKDAAISTSEITPEIMSLLNFKQKLSDLGHFYTNYKDINDLKFQFNNQLTKFLPKLTGISPSKIQQNNAQEPQTAPKVVQNFYGSVGTATGNVGRDQNITNIKNQGNRNIKIGQGNYNENIQGDYIDQSRTQNISGGTIDASGAGAFSMGDNYGTIANTVNQNSDFDNSSNNQLKQLLIQLQNTIKQENIDSDTKSDFLDEIEVILEALPNSQNDSTKKQANKSMRALNRIADDLPSNSATVNLWNQLPDLIAQVF